MGLLLCLAMFLSADEFPDLSGWYFQGGVTADFSDGVELTLPNMALDCVSVEWEIVPKNSRITLDKSGVKNLKLSCQSESSGQYVVRALVVDCSGGSINVTGYAWVVTIKEGEIPASGSANPSKVLVEPHGTARLSADGVSEPGLEWRITPDKGVSVVKNDRGRLEFTAPPGAYRVELAAGKRAIRSWDVEFAKPAPKPAPKPKADPFNALGRIQFGNAGCTATVVWPRRADGRWDILTAEHCVDDVRVGSLGQMQLRDRDERFTVRLVAKDQRSDVAWLVTESASLGDLPYAVLAEKNAPAGTKVWHAGFGVDRPGNRESGEVTRDNIGTGKAEMLLSVSSGDSGGGIFRADTGELISTVCCTTRRGAKVAMYGGNVESIRRLRPDAKEKVSDWWFPSEVPEVGGALKVSDWWRPKEVPTSGLASGDCCGR